MQDDPFNPDDDDQNEWARRHAARENPETSKDGAEKAWYSAQKLVHLLMEIFEDEGMTANEWADKAWATYPGRVKMLDYWRRRVGTCKDNGLVEWRLLPNDQQNPNYLLKLAGMSYEAGSNGDEPGPLYYTRNGANINFRRNSNASSQASPSSSPDDSREGRGG